MSNVRSYLPEKINESIMYGIGLVRCYAQPYINTEFNANALVTEPRMLIGDLASASNREAMLEQGVTHVLCVLNGGVEQFPENFKYMIVHANDDPWVSIEEHFDDAIKFIDSALTSSPTAKILVHCQRGASRSVTLVAAYLLYNLNRASRIRKRKINSTVIGVIDTIRSVREIAAPNEGFIESLKKYICKLNNYLYTPPKNSSSSEDSVDRVLSTSTDTDIAIEKDKDGDEEISKKNIQEIATTTTSREDEGDEDDEDDEDSNEKQSVSNKKEKIE